MNGDVEEEAPRPRPLSAGIWTLFSWLRRTERSSSSESVSSVGSDRTVASFDFLAPLNYKQATTPFVLSQGPVTETYKKRLHERNLRRQHDRDLTLRRKYGLFTEEGLGYDAFSLPSARRLQKETPSKQDRDRRATSESIRRTPYVPGKRRAPLPPAVAISATLPRNYKRKRPAPKPPAKLSEENKENVAVNKNIQMNSGTDKHSFLSDDASPVSKSEKHSKPVSKEVKLRTDKGFLKQIFDNKKRYSAIDTSRIKLLPSISELDKQAAEIIEANKSLQSSRGTNYNLINCDNNSASDSHPEETWMCTTCLKKYKPVVKCCIYCLIKENSPNNKKHVKNFSTNVSQTNENVTKSNRNSLIEDKKKLREMLKEMKDSLPKRPKHNNKCGENSSNVITSIETPTLRIGTTIDENMNHSLSKKRTEIERDPKIFTKTAKQEFLNSAPSSSKQTPLNLTTDNVAFKNPKSELKIFSSNSSTTVNLNNNSILNVHNSNVLVNSVKKSNDTSKILEQPRESQSNVIAKLNESQLFLNSSENNKLNDYSALHNNKNVETLANKHDNKVTNTVTENKSGNNQSSVNLVAVESKDIAAKMHGKSTDDTHSSLLSHNLNSVKEVVLTETTASVNNKSYMLPAHKDNDNRLESKNKIERVQLGNVLSPDELRIKQIDRNPDSNINKNINLHTPLKISSLLNPLYCPKYKIANDKEGNCNNVPILSNKAPNTENKKKEEASSNEQAIVPDVTISTSVVNEQTASTSNTKLVRVTLQKSEVDTAKSSKDIKSQFSSSVVKEKLKDRITENASTNTTSCLTVTDHHARRRDLINQLEQAISKGDEQTAAQAAAKLAKLKLSCSVLSFSSQIVAEEPSHKLGLLKDNSISADGNETESPMNQKSASNILNAESKIAAPLLDKALIGQFDEQNATTSKKITLKESTNLTEATTSTQMPTDIITIEVWVEDKEAARGPIPLQVSRKARIGELKQQAETSFGLEIRLQRWIVGRTLCTEDSTSLVAVAGPDLNAPFYLCVVESDINKDNLSQIKDATHIEAKTTVTNNVTAGEVYTELMRLEQQALVSNTDEFECCVCIERCAVGAGAVLRECIHTFCKECLADVVRHCEEPVVACPAIGCPGALQDREIRALLSAEELERWLARSLAAAESGTRNTFHCRTRDCKGWAFCEPGVRRFPCPVCKHTNCVPCQAVHAGKSCEQYQAKLREAVTAAETDQTDEGTQALLKSLISRGEALECPECNTIITKKWGCDWVKCSACKTEICWITKGRRWGPAGKGDTSGGCRCGVDGKRCHPSCGYCH